MIHGLCYYAFLGWGEGNMVLSFFYHIVHSQNILVHVSLWVFTREEMEGRKNVLKSRDKITLKKKNNLPYFSSIIFPCFSSPPLENWIQMTYTQRDQRSLFSFFEQHNENRIKLDLNSTLKTETSESLSITKLLKYINKTSTGICLCFRVWCKQFKAAHIKLQVHIRFLA